MGKRYCKMSKKANGKIREIRDEQVVLELPHKRRNVRDHPPPHQEAIDARIRAAYKLTI